MFILFSVLNNIKSSLQLIPSNINITRTNTEIEKNIIIFFLDRYFSIFEYILLNISIIKKLIKYKRSKIPHKIRYALLLIALEKIFPYIALKILEETNVIKYSYLIFLSFNNIKPSTTNSNKISTTALEYESIIPEININAQP